jgi:plasmid maintenance system killer protein
MKREFAAVVDELLQGNVGAGRRFEKLRFGEHHYSVRLSSKYRFVFQILANGNAKPVAVGPHDEAYRLT